MAVKDEVLKHLEQNKDKDFSGQLLADKLGVSRNSVWKAINALKDEGYNIVGTTNKGYRLNSNSDVVSKEEISRYLENKDLDVIIYKDIDSTNNEAKRLLVDGVKKNTLIIAESQSAGRGRQGKQFYSPEKTGLYMTLIIKFEANIIDVLPITTMAAVAVCRSIENLTDLEPKIKWVNDVYINNKKVCGILSEASSDFEMGEITYVILGIGINVFTKEFPEQVRDIAASLDKEGITRSRLSAEITNNVLEISRNLNKKEYIKEYKKRSLVIGKDITYIKKGISYEAKAIGIDDDGGLIIEDESGTSVLNSGEISLRIK